MKTTITYAIFPSPLDLMLVASTEKGICFVGFGGSSKALEASLRREFPLALFKKNAAQMKKAAASVLQKIKSKGKSKIPMIDIQPTTFQGRVWDHLQSIPWGTLSTYSEIAAKLGHPKAVRAVAKACATNPLAGLIACHRVVAKNGELRGYRWGLKRKQRLLDLEKS